MLLHRDTLNITKLAAITTSFVGGCIIIAWGGGTVSHGITTAAPGEGLTAYIGNFCLIVNCMSFAAYFIYQNDLLKKYPAALLAAW